MNRSKVSSFVSRSQETTWTGCCKRCSWRWSTSGSSSCSRSIGWPSGCMTCRIGIKGVIVGSICRRSRSGHRSYIHDERVWGKSEGLLLRVESMFFLSKELLGRTEAGIRMRGLLEERETLLLGVSSFDGESWVERLSFQDKSRQRLILRETKRCSTKNTKKERKGSSALWFKLRWKSSRDRSRSELEISKRVFRVSKKRCFTTRNFHDI